MFKNENVNVTQSKYPHLAPVHIAADLGELEILQWLIQQRANLNCRDDEGNNPLHKAVDKTQDWFGLAKFGVKVIHKVNI